MEWRTPTQVEGMKGQKRNNSGVFFQQRYEVQVLDSYENPTYSNGQAGSIYSLANSISAAYEPHMETYYPQQLIISPSPHRPICGR